MYINDLIPAPGTVIYIKKDYYYWRNLKNELTVDGRFVLGLEQQIIESGFYIVFAHLETKSTVNLGLVSNRIHWVDISDLYEIEFSRSIKGSHSIALPRKEGSQREWWDCI